MMQHIHSAQRSFHHTYTTINTTPLTTFHTRQTILNHLKQFVTTSLMVATVIMAVLYVIALLIGVPTLSM